MAKKLIVLILISIISLFVSVELLAEQGDLQREARLRSEIEDMIFDGEPLSLVVDNHEFLGVYTEADEPKAGIVIIHGRGFHPDWQDVVAPLRVGLVESGWSTLSIQMPVLEKHAKYYDYVPLFDGAARRIDRAIDYLQENGVERVILLAHSCGAHMAMHWVDLAQDIRIQGFIGLGMGATDFQQTMAKPFPLGKLKIPVLDLYGEDDYPAVLKMAPRRLTGLIEGGDPKSRQQSLPGANHYFTGKDDELVDVVHEWLDTLDF